MTSFVCVVLLHYLDESHRSQINLVLKVNHGNNTITSVIEERPFCLVTAI
jgi:hypothetical protein